MSNDGAAELEGQGQRVLWLVGGVQDWLASAVIDQRLIVRWAPSTEQVPAQPLRADAGILVLAKSDIIPADSLSSMAPTWTVIQSGPGFGGRRVERAAAAALSVIPNCRFIPLPDLPWTARARSAGVQTRESLAEILASLGLAGIVAPEALPGAGHRKTG